MAIANSDGSIILSTKVDTAGLSKGMTSMTGIVSKLGGAMAAAFSVKMIANFAKESKSLYKIQMQNEVKLATVMRQRMNATDEQIQKVMDLASAEQGLGIIGDEVQLAGLQQLATFAKQQETIESLLPAMNNLIAQQYGFEASTESARNVANLMGKVLQGQTGALTRVGITFTEAQEQVLKYGTESEKAATLAQVITDNVGEMNKALAKTDIGRQQQLSNTLGDIKEQFGEAITQIEIFFLPLLQTLAETLSGIAVIFKSATNSFFNGGKENEAEWKSIENNSNKTAENIEEQVENQKDLNKEMKKTLAGFDDIQILSANTADNTSGGGLDSGLQGIGGDFGGNSPDGSAYVEEIDETLTAIMGIVALSLAAVGLILLFTGHIGYGIGFIIAGAATLTVTMASASEFGYDGIIQMLTTIMGVAGGALLALGIILLWIGGVVGKPVAIGMIIAGGALIVSAVAAQAAFSPDDIAAWLSLIMGIAGGALLALGVILCMVGIIPLGVGMIIVGAVSLVSAVVINSDAVVEAIRGPIGIITAIVSGALLVLGIILVCAGILPLGIGLIAAGAIGLATVVAINWNAIVEALQGPIGAITSIVGGALLVLGIILVCTGVGIPVGIGLILAGAAGLATVVAVNWDSIVDWVKVAFEKVMDWVSSYGGLVLGIILLFSGVGAPFGLALIMDSISSIGKGEKPALWDSILENIKRIWNNIKSYWNANIANVWTLKFWLDLAKIAGNGLISGFESAINGIIVMFEKMINWIVNGLNKISFDIPDWLGGGSFGINIPNVSFGRVSIPRLAQGAVIPPNREFLAVLGDNKKENEIVSPVSTMKQAFMEAMMEMGATGQTTKEEHYYLNETELMSIMYRLVRGGERLKGESLVNGGAY